MPVIRFTNTIQRHVACPSAQVEADNVAAALEAYFELHPRARGYVLDDQARLRRHMGIFINGQPVRDRDRLSDGVEPGDTVDVMQALSGG